MIKTGSIIHKTRTKNILDLQNLYERDHLNLEPGFQRQSVWTERDRAVVDPGAFAELYRGQIQAVAGEGWEGDEHVVRFHHKGVPRVIRWVCRDNLDFLARAVDLAFYFHRGDSEGAGSSGQLWDSELLPMLAAKIPPGGRCCVVTDGQPGGLHPALRRLAHRRAARPAVRSAASRPIRSAASAVIAAPDSEPPSAYPATFLHRLGRYYVGRLGPNPADFIISDDRPSQRPLPFK